MLTLLLRVCVRATKSRFLFLRGKRALVSQHNTRAFLSLCPGSAPSMPDKRATVNRLLAVWNELGWILAAIALVVVCCVTFVLSSPARVSGKKVIAPPAAAATPLSEQKDDVLWFDVVRSHPFFSLSPSRHCLPSFFSPACTQISDIHLSKFHNENGANFHRYVKQERPLVAPAFTLVTGDIADSHRASHSIPLHSKQQVDEWQSAKATSGPLSHIFAVCLFSPCVCVGVGVARPQRVQNSAGRGGTVGQ